MTTIAEAVSSGELPGRVWFYSNYHCNLACTYCLTESAPGSKRRILPLDQIADLSRQAVALGFRSFGITGGEPFLLAGLPDLLLEMSELGETVALTNGTVFGEERLARLRPLAGTAVAIQISLDGPTPELNDELRGPDNFATVIDLVPRLVDMGIRVRIATTVEDDRLDSDQHAELCALHRSLGVPDDEHLVRPIIRRGRAETSGMGEHIDHLQIPAELTITADGAFWSPFGPTVVDGRVETDLLLTRTIDPIERPATALASLVGSLPDGYDAQIGIR
jgi:MoaA/NifB/PqqE/SkfB family radical SAM enzyme